MPDDRIAALLTRRTGLTPNSLGPEAVVQAVRRRMAACGLSDIVGYEERLLASDEEWHLFVDEVVVRETWFFRDWTPFALLQRYVRERWLPRRSGRLLRVLSVPCATGEEACSIAIALLEAGLAGTSFQIDAVDISRTALARCREARYGESAFRGGHLELRDRYFTTVDGSGYRPLSEVTASISFRQGNLLETGFTAGRTPYDIVFCRNLLIYFDLPARKLAAENLWRLLADDGVLFAGHTESTHTLGPRFALWDDPRAFAYLKVLTPAPDTPAPPAVSTPRRVERPVVDAPPLATRGLAKVPTPHAAKPARVDDAPLLLERAKRLADEGTLDTAADVCRQLVERDDPSADAFCLLGLIKEALGDRIQAEGCYTRALFLDPDHYESLVHLILLLEARGDSARAAALRARLGRLGELENRHAS
jgi:chemotaxis protein methyltransferase WspC